MSGNNGRGKYGKAQWYSSSDSTSPLAGIYLEPMALWEAELETKLTSGTPFHHAFV